MLPCATKYGTRAETEASLLEDLAQHSPSRAPSFELIDEELLALVNCLLCAEHCSKCLADMHSFYPQRSSFWHVLLLLLLVLVHVTDKNLSETKFPCSSKSKSKILRF